MLLTATYQASFSGFKGTILDGQNEGKGIGEEEAGKYMRGAISIARSSFRKEDEGEKSGKGRIALSLGAYGATTIPGTEYSGLYDEGHTTVTQLAKWHLERLHVFLPSTQDSSDENLAREKTRCWGEVDMIAFETLPTRNENLAVRKVMESVPEENMRPFWIACVFPGEENFLPDGSTIPEVVEAMLGDGKGKVPNGIGINCTKVSKLNSLILEFENATGEVLEKEGREEWPALVVYPDGTKGEVYNTTTKEWEMVGKRESEVSFRLQEFTLFLFFFRGLGFWVLLRGEGLESFEGLESLC